MRKTKKANGAHVSSSSASSASGPWTVARQLLFIALSCALARFVSSSYQKYAADPVGLAVSEVERKSFWYKQHQIVNPIRHASAEQGIFFPSHVCRFPSVSVCHVFYPPRQFANLSAFPELLGRERAARELVRAVYHATVNASSGERYA